MNSCEEESVENQKSLAQRRVNGTANGTDEKKTDLKKTNSGDVTWTWNDVVWKNILFFGYMHLASIYGLYQIFTGQCKLATIFMAILLVHWGALGITAGAHRLWCHKGYKATWQLKLILTFFNTIAHHNGIWYWVQTHRIHHKHQDTHADPHSAARGLFFSHFGWMLLKDRPEVVEARKKMEMNDLLKDPFVMIQKNYYWYIMPLVSVVLPTWILCHFFGETLSAAWHVGVCLRHQYTLHDIFLINSFAHKYGTKPYDTSISPTENRLLSIMTQGEGWHNYHHSFPWDYKAAELGNWRYNISTGFIDLFAKIGWAYDLKTVSKENIQKRMAKSGDLNVEYSDASVNDIMQLRELKQEAAHPSEMIWGWDDVDFDPNEKKCATILNKA